ncbi:MAG: hypothetical protein IJA89_00095 [Clostridia bacterium]|nr:hypothetical protein [Clostridia bacterium]
MKIKTKKAKLFLLSALFAICMCFGILFGGGAVTASAAAVATPKYTMQLDYSIKTTQGSTGVSTSYTTGTAYSATVYKSDASTIEATVSLYGSSASGTGNFPKGSYINSSTVNLLINSSVSTGTITVYNSSGTKVGSGGKSLTLTGLANGSYSVEFYFGGAAWATSARSGVSKSTSATSSFYVDATAPTISGASTSSTGKYTNAAFTVTATDTGGSGIKALYYKTPSASSYSTVASSITFSAGSTNGVYYFYTIDNAGNQSATYYVYYDNVKPTGVIKNASGTTLTSTSTNGAFSYTASDSGCGISYLQYMTPSSSSWTSYTSGTTIAATTTNGTYQFRAVDKAGNISSTTSMILDTTKPVGVLYSGTTAVSSGAKSTASYIKYVASDALSGLQTAYVKKPNESSYATYTSGTQLTTNGTYSFYCTDKAGNTSDTVTLSLDNTPPVVTLSKGDWGDTLSSGFTVSATDNIGGTILYYKTPNGSFVQSTSASVSIAKTQPDGTYQFYAVDGYGNTSATYSVELYIAAPVAQIVKASDGNQVCVIWTDNNVTGKLNGTSYTNGTWIKTEGNHTFVLTNDANRSTTYTFSIDHYYRQKTVVAPTCTTQGYTVYECDNCGDTYNANFVSALGHNYIVTREVESTCTAEGYSVYVCTRCQSTYNDDIVSANGHDFSGWYIVKDSTCIETGIRRRDCISCGAYETEEVEAKGHDYVATITEPTCVEQGFTTHVCSRCDDTYTDSDTQALGHNYEATVTEPTCTERGYTTQTCSRCGDNYVEDYVNAHGHSYGVWRIASEPTCLDNGLRYKICDTCSYRYNESIPALGHDYGAEVVEPTCVDKGYTTHICSRCGTGYNDTFVDALGHDYRPLKVEPTCTEEGYVGQCCSRCSDTYKTEILKASGHDYVETYVEVTCTEEGCVLHICLTCGYEYKTDIVKPMGHSLETNVLLASTCEETGERYYGCTKCDYERIDEIPAQGHNYELVDEENEEGVITRTYVCTVCAKSYEQDMGAQYEKVSNYVEYLFDEYSPYMVWVFLATAGVWSIAMGIAMIIAHKNEDKAKAKKMLVNYGIGLVVIFAILVAVPYLVRGIAFLVS